MECIKTFEALRPYIKWVFHKLTEEDASWDPNKLYPIPNDNTWDRIDEMIPIFEAIDFVSLIASCDTKPVMSKAILDALKLCTKTWIPDLKSIRPGRLNAIKFKRLY